LNPIVLGKRETGPYMLKGREEGAANLSAFITLEKGRGGGEGKGRHLSSSTSRPGRKGERKGELRNLSSSGKGGKKKIVSALKGREGKREKTGTLLPSAMRRGRKKKGRDPRISFVPPRLARRGGGGKELFLYFPSADGQEKSPPPSREKKEKGRMGVVLSLLFFCPEGGKEGIWGRGGKRKNRSPFFLSTIQHEVKREKKEKRGEAAVISSEAAS